MQHAGTLFWTNVEHFPRNETEMSQAELYYEQQFNQQNTRENWYGEAINRKRQAFSNFGGDGMDVDNDSGVTQQQSFSTVATTEQTLPQRGPGVGTCSRAHTFDYGNKIWGNKMCNLCKRVRDTFFKCTTCGGQVCQGCCWNS